MSVHSNVDLPLLNGLLSDSPVFLPLSPVLHLLVSVCTQFHHLFLIVLLVDFPQDYR